MKQVTATKIVLIILSCMGAISPRSSYADQLNCRPVYECGCNPLYCGTYSLQLHAGIAPIIWRNRGEVDLLTCNANPENPVFQLASEFPKFRSVYKLPWTFGGLLSYAWTDNIETYLEFDYLQAARKHDEGLAFVIPNVQPTQALLLKLGKYNLIEGYIGIRYYWNRFCDWVAPFAGVKVGFTAHRNVNATLSVNGVPLVLAPAAGGVCQASNLPSSNHYFNKNTVISGGLNAGLDICFCGGWSFVVAAEFIASAGPRVRTASVFATPIAAPTLATNLILGCFGSELRFPITFGIKKTF